MTMREKRKHWASFTSVEIPLTQCKKKFSAQAKVPSDSRKLHTSQFCSRVYVSKLKLEGLMIDICNLHTAMPLFFYIRKDIDCS